MKKFPKTLERKPIKNQVAGHMVATVSGRRTYIDFTKVCFWPLQAHCIMMQLQGLSRRKEESGIC